MATATPNTKTVTRTVEETVTDGVVLTLNDEEARVLAFITGNIGGPADTTRRGVTDGIGRALRDIGFDSMAQDFQVEPANSAIYFTN